MSQRLLDSYRLLCITPDIDVREEIARGMPKYGYQVTTSESRANALARHGSILNYYHTIMIDDDLFGSTEGPHFARFLRERGYDGQIVVATHRITPATEIPYQAHNIHSLFRKEPMDVGRLASYLVEKK